MKIVLAPMEGVIDYAMRELLTSGGAYDHAVTEFVRINDMLLPNSAFYKYCPELKQNGKTKSGTPVYVQLLGQHSNWMADNAVRAVSLGALGIDLNFGCPAKTVNRHRGGSVLLKEPNVVHEIVKAVRQAVPDEIPVTVKMRLGYDDKTQAIENAIAIEEAGANCLAVHARTKTEGYKPPAHWHWIAKIKDQVKIPLVANGDIWSRADAIECMKVSGCGDIMIGRGGLSLPNLADTIKNDVAPLNWEGACRLLVRYSAYVRDDKSKNFLPNRIKQWFTYLRREYKQADDLFQEIKTYRELDDIISIMHRKFL